MLGVSLTVLAIIAVMLLVWQLSHVLILVFAAMIVAAILFRAAQTVEQHSPLNMLWSKVISWLLIGVAVLGFLLALGAQVVSEMSGLIESLPDLLAEVGSFVGIDNTSQFMTDQVAQVFNRPNIFGDLAGLTTGILGALTTIVIVVFGGVFLAADPGMYRNGLKKLVPGQWSDRAGEAMDAAAQSLSLWLVGKLIAMIVIGAATYVGLLIIGLPSALALAVIAGLLEFVPMVGPIVSALPALLVAVPEGIDTVLWVLGLYVAIQQLEGALLVPVVQQRTAELPPVLGLFSIIAFGSLFGVPGIIVAAPLTIVLMVLVKHLYVGGVLGRDFPPQTPSKGDKH